MISPTMTDALCDEPASAEDLYLDLLKRCLTRSLFGETFRRLNPNRGGLRRPLSLLLERILDPLGLQLVRRYAFDAEKRALGHDMPAEAETMVGLRRLENLEYCITDALNRGVPGDLI